MVSFSLFFPTFTHLFVALRQKDDGRLFRAREFAGFAGLPVFHHNKIRRENCGTLPQSKKHGGVGQMRNAFETPPSFETKSDQILFWNKCASASASSLMGSEEVLMHIS